MLQILKAIPTLLLVEVACCFPHLQPHKLVDVQITNPQDVNSLQQAESQHIIHKKPSNNFEKIVKEVEKFIRANSTLPRLTRGEIYDILENITRKNYKPSSTAITKKDTRQQKSVMVVMPYTPSKDDKSIEDLYTRAPITRIIEGESSKAKPETNSIKNTITRRQQPANYNDRNMITKKTFEKNKSASSTEAIETLSTVPSRRRILPVSTDKPSTTSTTYYPPNIITTYHPKRRRPIRRQTTILTSSTTEASQAATHGPPDVEHFFPSDGLKVIESPILVASYPKYNELEGQENFKHEVTVLPDTISSKLSPLIDDVEMPNHIKKVIKDLNVETVLNPETAAKMRLEERLKSTIAEQNRIKNLLITMGVLPEKPASTTTTATPSAELVADALNPEMRDLLMSFGLLPNPNEKPEPLQPGKFYPEKANVDPNSYIGFKPLPEDGPTRDDMDALLASFGLGRSARKEKSLKTEISKPKYNFDIVPNHLKSIVSDMGLAQLNSDQEEKKSSPTKQHIFNPDIQYVNEEELKKIDKLMNLVKQLEKLNGTVTDEELKNIDLESLQELITSVNQTSNKIFKTLEITENSPDPTEFDIGVIKNEVKRQEETTPKPSIEIQTPSLKDLEDSFGGQTDFTTLPPLMAQEIPETTTQKTGFYYLVDWNTFLDIDDTKGKRVNLRLQPTIGDPKRFYSVSTP